jgi:hypothetical protein
MDDYLQNKTSTNPDASATPSQRFTFISNNALVFNRGATGVDNDDFDKKFSLAKTLTIFMINHSVFTTMLSIAGTKVKTVKYCSG